MKAQKEEALLPDRSDSLPKSSLATRNREKEGERRSLWVQLQLFIILVFVANQKRSENF